MWFTVGLFDPKHWPRLCAAMEREDLLTDPRSAGPFDRAANREWLFAELRTTIRTRPRTEWLDRIAAQDVPTGPVYDYAGVVAEEQFWENGYLQHVEHPHFPGHPAVGIPVVMSETPPRVQGVAPELGQHTEEVLLALGYSWDDIERLHGHGVIAKLPVASPKGGH